MQLARRVHGAGVAVGQGEGEGQGRDQEQHRVVSAQAGRPQQHVEHAAQQRGDQPQRPGRPQRRALGPERDLGDRERRREPQLGQCAAQERGGRGEGQATDVVERAGARDDQQQDELDEGRRQLGHAGPREVQKWVPLPSRHRVTYSRVAGMRRPQPAGRPLRRRRPAPRRRGV